MAECVQEVPAVLSQAGLSLRADFVTREEEAALLAEIDALPAESQAKLASWREAAEIRAAALAAADALAQGLTD